MTVNPATVGPFAGISVYQPAANSQAISFSGNAIGGIRGTIYAPSAQLVESGNAQISAGLIVDTLHMSGNAGASVAALVSPVQTVMTAVAQLTVENALVSAVAQAAQTPDATVGAFARHAIRIQSARGTVRQGLGQGQRGGYEYEHEYEQEQDRSRACVRSPVVPGGPIARWRRRLGAEVLLFARQWNHAR